MLLVRHPHAARAGAPSPPSDCVGPIWLDGGEATPNAAWAGVTEIPKFSSASPPQTPAVYTPIPIATSECEVRIQEGFNGGAGTTWFSIFFRVVNPRGI